ncbi:uncharacterized protein LOC106693275 [Microplitis demolitor]|uniref:uncharacterized protein LOC106693275 n=1 Tax=Microplitis demolitor TaxID=69319 RepID=UPI00235B6294|nr:uncharacterized protein LOC106693275 [Microplitis demolitor]
MTLHSLHNNASITIEAHVLALLMFWYQEEPQTEFTTGYTEEQEECEQHFVNTHYRQSDGRYVVRLPLKSLPSQLGDSLRAAQYALLRLRKRLEADPVYKKLYFDFLKEYEDLRHMKRIKLKDLPPNSYLLPHHGVLKEHSTTTKLRVIFNGSWKTTFGLSVNEILHAVEPLTNTRYVDDIYGGADELAEAIQVALDIINMCAAGCFPLAK